MCWKGYKVYKKKSNNKDIPVYKILRYSHSKGLVSPFMKTQYQLNEIKTQDIKITEKREILYGNKKNEKISIEQGLHCYHEDCQCSVNSMGSILVYSRKVPQYFRDLDLPIIEHDLVGFYSNYIETQFSTIDKTGSVVIAKGYIPKGTTYYENENGEIVAEAICITKWMGSSIFENRLKRYERKLFKDIKFRKL